MDIYDKLREGVERFIQTTDKRIEDIKRSSINTSYENIEMDLRRSASQLLQLISGGAQNNTATEMSNV